MADTCSTCRFWDKREPQHIYADCRRLPPVMPLSVDIRRESYPERDRITVDRFPHARWPNTSADDWCGEFSARAATPAPEKTHGD